MLRTPAIAFFLAATAPAAWGQDSELDRLKREVEQLRAQNAELLRRLSPGFPKLPDPAPPGEPAWKKGALRSAALGSDLAHAAALAGRLAIEGSGSVTATAAEAGLVVVSLGSESGLATGDQLSISRSGTFVARIALERVDQMWSAARVLIQTSPPQVGDQIPLRLTRPGSGTEAALRSIKVSVGLENASIAEILQRLESLTGARVKLDPSWAQSSEEAKRRITFKVQDLDGLAVFKLLTANTGLEFHVGEDGQILLAPPSSGVLAPAPSPATFPARLPRESGEELKTLRKELDEVRAQVRQLSDHLVPSWREAGLATEELSDAIRAQLGVARGVLVRQVQEGSPASRCGLKPFDVVVDRDEPELLRILREGGALQVIRQGRALSLRAASR